MVSASGSAFILSCVMLGASALQASESVSPVQKVIQIMEENKVKVTNDLAAEEKEMAEYSEFCDKEASEKGYAIETATRTIEDLNAGIEDCNSRIPARQADVERESSAAAAKERQLYEATELRKKERTDFGASEGELVKAVEQLGRAVTIIKRETGAASFAQVSSKSAGSKGLDMALDALSKIVDSGRLSSASRRSIEGLMQTETYQQLRQPQAKEVVYESKSGGIIAKIEEMKEKAEETLSGARNDELKTQQDFDMLEQSLNNGIRVHNEKIGDAKTRISTRTQEKEKATGDLVQTEASKKADEEYAAQLKHDCAEAASNWAARQESARGEIGAINKAIEILSEGVRVLLQMGNKDDHLSKDEADFADDSVSSTQSSGANTDTLARSRLVQKLKDMSHKFGSYALMEMAGSAAMDPFVKIRNLIEEMIAKLISEANEEATQKAFCDEEMGKSTKSKSDKSRTLDKLQSRIDKASSRTAELGQAVKDLEGEVASLDKGMAEATKLRNEEHATYLQASKDFSDAANAVERAIKVLKEFYDNQSLLQTGAQRTSKATAPDFGGAKSDAASVIISILEMSGEDFTKLHSETETNEAEAQESYDKQTNDNKASKGAKEAEVKASQSEIKSLAVALKNSQEDHGMTSSELDAVLDYLEKLKPQCESKAMSYAEKKSRREAEIAGLKEALEILEGNTLALVQTKQFLSHAQLH